MTFRIKNRLSRSFRFLKKLSACVAEGIVEALDDPFGPQMLFRTNDFSENLTRLAADQTSPFHRFRRMTQPLPWLFGALAAIERMRSRLQIKASDIETDEWAPLKLDRSEPELMEVIAAVDEVIGTVRGDNGYAENMPLEREFILQSLATFSKTLKEAAATSVPYIRRYAIEPLTILGRRFAKGALEVTIAAAKETLKTWLKKHGLDWLNAWWIS
jgi:hypothetical protein